MRTLMPRPSRLRLPPLKLGSETFGERLARIRKERGITQVELAKKTGLLQALISAYECDRLRLRADIVVRFAIALNVSTDELLGLKATANDRKLSRRVLRRMHKLEQLAPAHQRALLKTIDTYVQGALAANAHRRSRASG
jgi:transcriptional regulator with XRE-family HTH domain